MTTKDRNEQLKTATGIAQIVAWVAMPLVLAGVGYMFQRAVADEGVKKDYVQIALGVLKEPPDEEKKVLRQWAIAILDKNSPVPIPTELKSQLTTSKFGDFISITKSGTELKEIVQCKPAPDERIVDWLVSNYPRQFTRCANGQLGEKSLDLGKYLSAFPPASSALR